MVNYSTNINKMNHYPAPQIIEHIKTTQYMALELNSYVDLN